MFRKQNCALFFVKANDTVELSLSQSRRVTTKVDPTTFDDFVVDDMIIFIRDIMRL